MDRFARIRTARLRHVVAAAFVAAGIGAGLALALAGWLIHRAVATGEAPNVLLMGGVAIVAALALIAGVWFLLDRHLEARETDHRMLPARPEFFDFEALNQPMHVEEVGGRPLRQLTYVVFDTETTGLSPSGGDEIISIAGVRVRDGRVEDATPFTRLVDPGRPIPRASTRFHGITDDMVRGERPAAEVLPEFKAFVGDAVLVAHNAAFDMRFLKLKEAASGTRFDNLVLDTLLLSVFLEHESRNHSLDAIAERLGVDVVGRHTALGDARVTAEVFLRMLEMLEARGVTTLRQAVEASLRIEHVRKMQERF